MQNKQVTLEEAATLVERGCTLGMTASELQTAPMAFLRELVRRGIGGLNLVGVTGGGLNFDLLIGAGAVASADFCHLSLGELGPAPNFQRHLRLGTFKLKDNT
jgi:acyl CoA:acetate/3-ketoacid CoA transferase alpha subunit